MVERRDRAELTPRAREMVQVIAEQERSGLSIRAFARKRGIPEGTIAWWRRELRLRGCMPVAAASPSVMIPVAVVDDDVPTPSVSPPPSAAFTLILAGGMRVELPHGFDSGELRRLIEAVAC